MVLKTLTFLALLFVSTISYAADIYKWNLPVKVIRVIDGDTVVLEVMHGCKIKSSQTVRLLDIDAPELVTDDGKSSKTFLSEKIVQGRDWAIAFNEDKTDSFGRLLVHLFVLDEEKNEWQNLNQLLLDHNYAKKFKR